MTGKDRNTGDYPAFRPVGTVGALIRQLERLPASMPLVDKTQVTVYVVIGHDGKDKRAVQVEVP